MRVRIATLCDAASVREGLLNILGGGITVLHRESYPAPIACTLALLLETRGATEQDQVTSLQIEIVHLAADAEVMIGEISAELQRQGDPAEIDSQSIHTLPLVLDLQESGIPSEGSYDIRFKINDEIVETLPFSARITDLQNLP